MTMHVVKNKIKSKTYTFVLKEICFRINKKTWSQCRYLKSKRIYKDTIERCRKWRIKWLSSNIDTEAKVKWVEFEEKLALSFENPEEPMLVKYALISDVFVWSTSLIYCAELDIITVQTTLTPAVWKVNMRKRKDWTLFSIFKPCGADVMREITSI